MKENSQMDKKMEQGNLYYQMVALMKELGKMISNKDQVKKIGQMVQSIQATIKMI